jgi:hypothetical protein
MSLLSRIDRESSGMVSAEQFLEIFSAKWIEEDSEELQVAIALCGRLSLVTPPAAVLLFPL